jgi:hypothetical protein
VIEVVATETFSEWFMECSAAETDAIVRVVALLQEKGADLRRPHSDKLKDSRIDLRELRANAPNATIRILYAFDPIRQAVLLVGGDKRGEKRFYKRMIPLAERLFAEYLLEVK